MNHLAFEQLRNAKNIEELVKIKIQDPKDVPQSQPYSNKFDYFKRFCFFIHFP